MRDLPRMTLRTALGMAHATAIFLDLFHLALSARITTAAQAIASPKLPGQWSPDPRPDEKPVPPHEQHAV
jgi:hypothetical protein